MRPLAIALLTALLALGCSDDDRADGQVSERRPSAGLPDSPKAEPPSAERSPARPLPVRPDAGPADAGPADAALIEAASDAENTRAVYRIEVRVHTAHTGMDAAKLAEVLAETQLIWTSQASICFQFRRVADDVEGAAGFDLWYLPEIPDAPEVNGAIEGRRILVRDHPVLAPALRPAKEPAARTTAHELGHGLTLEHYTDPSDLSESLMASRQAGFALHDFEIERARTAASTLGQVLGDTDACAALR